MITGTLLRAYGRPVIGCLRQVAGLLVATETGQSENAANDRDPFAAGIKMPGIVTLNERLPP
jgi:hypothetical protein